jgi:hypothetical protein
MSGELREPMTPDQVVMGGFVEQYDATRYRDVSHLLYMQHNHLMHDQDLPAPVQVFTEDGQIRVMRLYFDGYFIVPLKRVMTHPAYVFDTVRRLVYVDGKAPRSQRVRFWLASQLLRAAGRLLSKTAGP